MEKRRRGQHHPDSEPVPSSEMQETTVRSGGESYMPLKRRNVTYRQNEEASSSLESNELMDNGGSSYSPLVQNEKKATSGGDGYFSPAKRNGASDCPNRESMAFAQDDDFIDYVGGSSSGFAPNGIADDLSEDQRSQLPRGKETLYAGKDASYVSEPEYASAYRTNAGYFMPPKAHIPLESGRNAMPKQGGASAYQNDHGYAMPMQEGVSAYQNHNGYVMPKQGGTSIHHGNGADGMPRQDGASLRQANNSAFAAPMSAGQASHRLKDAYAQPDQNVRQAVNPIREQPNVPQEPEANEELYADAEEGVQRHKMVSIVRMLLGIAVIMVCISLLTGLLSWVKSDVISFLKLLQGQM